MARPISTPAPEDVKPEDLAADASPNLADQAPETVGVVKTAKVKTSGDFNLLDPFSGVLIDANSEDQEVPHTPFVTEMLDTGKLEKID